jgi:hypothetical protein
MQHDGFSTRDVVRHKRAADLVKAPTAIWPTNPAPMISAGMLMGPFPNRHLPLKNGSRFDQGCARPIVQLHSTSCRSPELEVRILVGSESRARSRGNKPQSGAELPCELSRSQPFGRGRDQAPIAAEIPAIQLPEIFRNQRRCHITRWSAPFFSTWGEGVSWRLENDSARPIDLWRRPARAVPQEGSGRERCRGHPAELTSLAVKSLLPEISHRRLGCGYG